MKKNKIQVLIRYDKLEKFLKRKAGITLKITQLTLNKILKNYKQINNYQEQNLSLNMILKYF